MATDVNALYASKLTTPAEAVGYIASGTKLSMSMAMTQPPALLKALADRATAGDVNNLRIYYLESSRAAAETILRYELMDRIKPHCMFMSAAERHLVKRGMEDGERQVVTFIPSTFHQVPRLLTEIDIDTFMVTVSPMDRHGYFTLGIGNDYSSKVARSAKHLIIEVNEHMPRVHGTGAQLHVSEVTAIVENHVPLLELPSRPASPEDTTIARIIAGLVPDGACLQMGIGSLPNLVCSELGNHKDLGIHTEVLCSGLIDLIKAGAVTNRRKAINTGKTVFTFAVGQKAMYEFLHDNPSIDSQPVDYVNDPAVIARNDNVVSINATLQIDLTGACNSEHMLGHQYTGAGGQVDFVRGAYASKGGKSIIAAHATAANGTLSRIVARLDGPVTTPRIDTQIIVTEHGWADLKGKTSSERAEAVIALAHPAFRDELTVAARKMRLL